MVLLNERAVSKHKSHIKTYQMHIYIIHLMNDIDFSKDRMNSIPADVYEGQTDSLQPYYK